MTISIGKNYWAIAEGYIPPDDENKSRQLISHEACCILNAGDKDAQVKISVFFSDREPAGPYEIIVPAKRTKHVRFNDLKDPEIIPRDTDYSSTIESDVPVVVQHTRLDSRQAETALLSTIAYCDK